MSTQVFTTIDIINLTHLSRQQLDYWDRTRLLIPSIRQGHGKGTRRLYSLDDLFLLNFIRRLHRHNWSTQKIRKALNRLRTFMDSSEQIVLIDGRDTILALYKSKSGEQILLDTLNPSGQQVLTIVLETLIEETLSDIERFADEALHHV